MGSNGARKSCRVGLFVTCLVDLFRPSVGFAAVALLENAGCTVTVPSQTCCGQPAYNSGDRDDAAAIARQVVAAFQDVDHVVAPSGSCGGMIAHHYPSLFPEGSADRAAAEDLAGRTWELTSFLVDCQGMTAADIDSALPARVTYHDSCSGLREMKVKAQPRTLLAGVEGLSLTELPGAEICCGFGGTFCVKYPDISNSMVEEKAADISRTGADLLLAGDMGCLLNMAGKLHRQDRPVAVRHVAEVLAGLTSEPPIGAPKT